ncbi:MAG TPA: hypothetical protein VE645_14225 [Pseudonocardiaceae bacterium]|nr:hypothetical protein [Pseudonocardiaceae bacterium]
MTTQSLRRAVFGPVVVTGALAVLAVVTAVPPVVHQGWVLPWLLLGLTAGYSLSGSA